MSGRTQPREGNNKKRQKITINNGDGDTTPLCWEKKTLYDWMTRSNNEENNYNKDLNFINDTVVCI